ncbi:MAG: hypothetical protein WAU07_03170 [Microgenomates group bacterium]
MLKRSIELLRNAIQAEGAFREAKMRQPINFFETTVFSFLMSLQDDLKVPSKIGIHHVYLLQDFMERQNYRTDEERKSESVWDDQFILELHSLLSQIADDYEREYGGEAEERYEVFFTALLSWYCNNPIIEDFIQGIKTQPDSSQSIILEKIQKSHASERAMTHKEEVAKLWITTSLAALYEGSEVDIENALDRTLVLTMLYQISEDMINLERDWRVDKRSLFTSEFDTFDAAKKTRPKLLITYLRKYFSQIDKNLYKVLIAGGWLARTIWEYQAARKHGSEWRQIDAYQSADSMEQKLNGIYLDNELTLPLKKSAKPLLAQTKQSDVYKFSDYVIKVPKKVNEGQLALYKFLPLPHGIQVLSDLPVLVSAHSGEKAINIKLQKKVDGVTLRNIDFDKLPEEVIQSLIELNQVEQNLLREKLFFDSVGRASESGDGIITKIKMLFDLYGFSSNIMYSSVGELVVIDDEVYENRSTFFRFVLSCALKFNKIKLNRLVQKKLNSKSKSPHSTASQN